MMIFTIMYRESDGEIVQWTNADPPIAPEGYANLAVEFGGIKPAVHRVQVMHGVAELIDKTPEEIFFSQIPQRVEVTGLRDSELYLSDRFIVADFPISAEARAAWIAYRQTLRDLTEHAREEVEDQEEVDDQGEGGVVIVHRTVFEMIEAFPIDPNGRDAAAALRARLIP